MYNASSLKLGWLVNDRLTCIPGTKTFWHDLLENVEGLCDKTNGHTDFSVLANKIKYESMKNGILPDYIIRNASYFGKIELPTTTISFLQDVLQNKETQIKVCNSSKIVVFNSLYTFKSYEKYMNCEKLIIPIGIDFELFTPRLEENNLGILPNSILWVGANNLYPKGIDKLMRAIEKTNYNFCLVMKDDFNFDHPRVKVFNKMNQSEMIKIYNLCEILLCTSAIETQHLTGIEAAACNLPIVTTDVGIYQEMNSGNWGMKFSDEQEMIFALSHVLKNSKTFSSRKIFYEKYDKNICLSKWKKLIADL